MANENNKIKLLLLWDILSKNTDENHAMNADEIREELAKRGISVMRKVIADDIAVLNEYGYEVLSYKKKYYYYYVVSRPIETAEDDKRTREQELDNIQKLKMKEGLSREVSLTPGSHLSISGCFEYYKTYGTNAFKIYESGCTYLDFDKTKKPRICFYRCI